MRTPGSARAWGFGLVLTALACGDASVPGEGVGGTSTGGTGDGGTSTGGTGVGGTSTGGTGDGGTSTGGTGDAGTLPGTCPANFSGYYGELSITDWASLQGTRRVRVLERGFRTVSASEAAATSLDDPPQYGWLRVVEIQDAVSGADASDAGAPEADAGASDAGTPAIERTITGPREVGELPVDIGDELEIESSFSPNPYGWHEQFVLRQGQRPLLLRHSSRSFYQSYASAGFTIVRGAALCSEPVGDHSASEPHCADSTLNEVVVIVPGGATATLGPAETKTIGEYRVLHGVSYAHVAPAVYEYSTECADLGNGDAPITAVLLP